MYINRATVKVHELKHVEVIQVAVDAIMSSRHRLRMDWETKLAIVQERRRRCYRYERIASGKISV